MAMTKKNYTYIAELVNFYLQDDMTTFDDFLFDLGNYFKEDNPRFNKDKFFKACHKST